MLRWVSTGCQVRLVVGVTAYSRVYRFIRNQLTPGQSLTRGSHLLTPGSDFDLATVRTGWEAQRKEGSTAVEVLLSLNLNSNEPPQKILTTATAVRRSLETTSSCNKASISPLHTRSALDNCPPDYPLSLSAALGLAGVSGQAGCWRDGTLTRIPVLQENQLTNGSEFDLGKLLHQKSHPEPRHRREARGQGQEGGVP